MRGLPLSIIQNIKNTAVRPKPDFHCVLDTAMILGFIVLSIFPLLTVQQIVKPNILVC